jgi:DNA invertase Pin-like site-specific DNA recombinase
MTVDHKPNPLETMPIEELAEIFGETKRDTYVLKYWLMRRISEAPEKISITEIARLTGLSRQTIYNWLNPKFDA